MDKITKNIEILEKGINNPFVSEPMKQKMKEELEKLKLKQVVVPVPSKKPETTLSQLENRLEVLNMMVESNPSVKGRIEVVKMMIAEKKKSSKKSAKQPTKNKKIKLKDIEILWAEGRTSNYDEFPKKYKSWKAANDAIKPIAKDNGSSGGYNKTKFVVTFADGETYEGRLDVTMGAEDNPFNTSNVVGQHIKDFLMYQIHNDDSPIAPKNEIQEWLDTYDLGIEEPKAVNKVTAQELVDKMVKWVNENGVDPDYAHKIKYIKAEDVSKLMACGVYDEIIMAFYCGIHAGFDWKVGGELQSDFGRVSGIFPYIDDYIEGKISEAIKYCQLGAYEIGLKYPDFDWSKILKGKPEEKIISGKPIEFSDGKKTTYEYKVLVYPNIVVGRGIGSVEEEPNSIMAESNIDRSAKVFEASYLGLVSSDPKVILDTIKAMAKQSKSYLKDIDILVNGLGGVGYQELDRNSIEYADGGSINNDDDYLERDWLIKTFYDGDVEAYEQSQKEHKEHVAQGGLPFADGGSIDRMYNFMEDDLKELEKAINEGNKEEVERFFSYWGQHLKSLKTKTNDRMYNFLKDDLKELEKAINEDNKEEIERFFSYWGYHLKSVKMADGGEVKDFEKELLQLKKNGHLDLSESHLKTIATQTKPTYEGVYGRLHDLRNHGNLDLSPSNINIISLKFPQPNTYANGGNVWTNEQSSRVEELDKEFQAELSKKGIDPYSKEASDLWRSGGYMKRMRGAFGKKNTYAKGGEVEISITDDDYTYTNDDGEEVETSLYGVFKNDGDNRINLINEYGDYFYSEEEAIEWAKNNGYDVDVTKYAKGGGLSSFGYIFEIEQYGEKKEVTAYADSQVEAEAMVNNSYSPTSIKFIKKYKSISPKTTSISPSKKKHSNNEFAEGGETSFLTTFDFTKKISDIANFDSLPKDVQDLIKSAKTIESEGFKNLVGKDGRKLLWSAFGSWWSEEEVAEHKQYNPELKVGFMLDSIGAGKDGLQWSKYAFGGAISNSKKADWGISDLSKLTLGIERGDIDVYKLPTYPKTLTTAYTPMGFVKVYLTFRAVYRGDRFLNIPYYSVGGKQYASLKYVMKDLDKKEYDKYFTEHGDLKKFKDGGSTNSREVLSFSFNTDNVSLEDMKNIVKGYTNDWRTSGDESEVNMFVNLTKDKANELEQELKGEDVYDVERVKSRFKQGGSTEEEEYTIEKYLEDWDSSTQGNPFEKGYEFYVEVEGFGDKEGYYDSTYIWGESVSDVYKAISEIEENVAASVKKSEDDDTKEKGWEIMNGNELEVIDIPAEFYDNENLPYKPMVTLDEAITEARAWGYDVDDEPSEGSTGNPSAVKITNIDEVEFYKQGGTVKKKSKKNRKSKLDYSKDVDAYNWYVIEKSTKKVLSGYESKDDAEEYRKDFDVNEKGKDAKEYKTVSKRHLNAMGIENPNEKWKKMGNGGEADDAAANRYIDSLIKYSDTYENGDGFSSRIKGATNKKGDKATGEYTVEGVKYGTRTVDYVYIDKDGKEYVSDEIPAIRADLSKSNFHIMKNGDVLEFRHNVPDSVYRYFYKTDRKLLDTPVEVEKRNETYEVISEKGGHAIVSASGSNLDENRTWEWFNENFDKSFDDVSEDKKRVLMYATGGQVMQKYKADDYFTTEDNLIEYQFTDKGIAERMANDYGVSVVKDDAYYYVPVSKDAI